MSEDEIEEVNSYYLSSIAEYKKFLEQHKVTDIPSLSPTKQHEMLKGPSPVATRLKSFSYLDSHGRKIKLCAMESDKEYSYRCCFYIYATIESLMYGRIFSLFSYTFISTTTTFAYVAWFESPIKGRDTKLSNGFTNVQHQSIVPVSLLSSLVVVAFDDQEPEKLWILS